MESNMARYKIVKKWYRGAERYLIYYKYFNLFWWKVGWAWGQPEAEQRIRSMKYVDDAKTKKPEHIGYY
jgi:hypothetical protein